MQLPQKGALLAVDLGRTKLRCDQCRRKHLKCNRGAPKCTNCIDFNLNCTREDAQRRLLKIHVVSRRTMLSTKDNVPETWDQAILLRSKSWAIQYFMRRYLMPLAFLLPKPTKASEIGKLTAYAMQLPTLSVNQTTRLKLNRHPEEILKANREAIEAFFCLYNPLFPLFSKEGFFSKPRSATLLKIVIQIGLERMPSTQLTHAAILANNLTLEEIKELPISLDTLQCQLLIYYGLEAPHIRPFCLLYSRFTDRIFPLLGLHISSSCLERTLAIQLFYNASHQIAIGQTIPIGLPIRFETTSDHLKQDYTKKRPRQLARTSDYIHYIASQTTFHSFATVFSAYKNHAKATKDKSPAHIFKAFLYSHMKHLEENFMWGWRHLSITSTRQKALLMKTRFVLALRYHSDYIELMKLDTYIPDDLNLPLSREPIKNKITEFTQRGLKIAVRNINLITTINSYNCDFEFMRIRTILPSVAFLITHYSTLISNHGHIQVVDDAISQVKACLKKSQEFPASKHSATCYLALIDFLIKANKPLTK
ncbi:hypothetical protein DSO57_1003187 [Entomophthora muscae]|uniref:Uncharacterized protein n=1 Tax=Entomophthora muscae TaxID=34485 RepID=A0ACC2SAD4_9FUNG|nr:hypothetical protein DSO57_1003187 [Entomophthora muscae]